MGVISITQRSERLGNLGGTSAAHGVTSTDIGQVRHTVARTFSPHYYNRNSHAGDGSIAAGLGKVGDTLVRIGAAVIQREEDRKVDDFANAMLDSMERQGRDDRDIDDWNTPDRKHLEGQKKGFYLRTGEGTKTVVDEWDRAFADTFRKIGDSIDANDRVRERTMEKLANYRRATVSRLADNQAAEYRRMEQDSAKGNLASQIALWKNGRTEVLPDIFAQQERVDSLSLATPDKRKANREALALKLTSDFVGNWLDQCQTPEDFDKVKEAVRGGLKDALPNEIAANLPGGERTVGGKMKDALLEDVKRAKRTFLAENDAAERENHQAVLRKFAEKELAIRDVPQELWADAYEALGNDEELKKTDPKRAMVYLDAARDMRKAAVSKRVAEKELQIRYVPQELWSEGYEELGNDKELRKTDPARAMHYLDVADKLRSDEYENAKKRMADIVKMESNLYNERVKKNEKDLATAFNRIEVLELSGELPRDEANEAQAALWRKFRAFSLSGEISEDFMRRFKNRLTKRLSDQEKKAMLKLYRAFGYNGDVTTQGYVKAEDRKNATSLKAPGTGESISALEFFAYGDAFLNTIHTFGPDIDRVGVVEAEIERLKTDWQNGKWNENREESLRNLMNIQRELRARFGMENDDGKSDDDASR